MTSASLPPRRTGARAPAAPAAGLLRRGALLWLGLACLSGQPASAQQECRVVRYGLTLGSDTTEYMTVKSGTSCSQSVTAPPVGPFGGTQAVELRPVTLSGISLVARAQHGNAGTNGATAYAYQARPGYVGPDQFVVLARGQGGTSRITVRVNVVP